MPDGSFTRSEQLVARIPQDQLPEAQQDLAQAQRREADALIVLKEKEAQEKAFFDLALQGERLTSDQKQLLEELRSDGDLSRLTRVVYTDPNTGIGHTFQEYFQGSEDVLQVAQRVIREREDADSTRRMAADIVMGKLKQTNELPVPIQETARYTLPKLEAKDDLVEFREQWATYQDKTREHMEHVRQYMETRWSMPNPLDHVTKRQPVQQEAPAQEEPKNPASFADPHEETVVMPAIQQETSKVKGSFASRLKGALKGLFG